MSGKKNSSKVFYNFIKRFCFNYKCLCYFNFPLFDKRKPYLTTRLSQFMIEEPIFQEIFLTHMVNWSNFN